MNEHDFYAIDISPDFETPIFTFGGENAARKLAHRLNATSDWAARPCYAYLAKVVIRRDTSFEYHDADGI